MDRFESLQEMMVFTIMFKGFIGMMGIFHGIENEPTRHLGLSEHWVYGEKKQLQFHGEDDPSLMELLGLLFSDKSMFC